MKKVIFAVIVALLAMLAVTCDSAVLPGKLAPEVVPDGEVEWVTISIGLDDTNARARAVTSALAQSSSDYFEVVFVNNISTPPSRIIVRSTRGGSGGVPTAGDWDVSVPKVNYGGAGNSAVLFAGKTGSPPVLLGIGVISTGGNLVSASGKPSIVFSVAGITSGVNKTLSNSAFSITGPSGFESPTTIPDGPAGNSAYPAFKIPVSTSYVASDPDNITAKYEFTNANFSYAILDGSATVVAGDVDSGLGGTITIGDIVPAAGAATTAFNGAVTFAIGTTATPGLAMLSIAAPVYAITNVAGRGATAGTTSTAEVWSIQGGLANTTLDAGNTINGGAVLIQVEAFEEDVELDNATDGDKAEWIPDEKILYYILNNTGSTSDNIVLTADAKAFSADSYIWRWSTTGEPTVASTDVMAGTGGIVGANVAANGTLTINSTSTDLSAGTTFYLKCFGVKSDSTVVESDDYITIIVQDEPNMTVGIGTPTWP